MTVVRILDLVYFMVPAYLANMAPPFVKFWPGWNRPISRRWLGDHKTIVGFILGVLVGILAAYIQSRIAWPRTLWPVSNWAVIGLASGFGAMAGDSIKSFFKRLVGVAPGKSWVPADQLDFPLGALLMLTPFVTLGWLDVAVILVVTFVGDIAINQISFRLGIRDTMW